TIVTSSFMLIKQYKQLHFPVINGNAGQGRIHSEIIHHILSGKSVTRALKEIFLTFQKQNVVGNPERLTRQTAQRNSLFSGVLR
ncbi:MAG TPA: hypothetical protein VN381_15770, partial [Anaerovoracaceae bacterium]|nr:hypothetical protein [Anaerovoracaceae bacterium]